MSYDRNVPCTFPNISNATDQIYDERMQVTHFDLFTRMDLSNIHQEQDSGAISRCTKSNVIKPSASRWQQCESSANTTSQRRATDIHRTRSSYWIRFWSVSHSSHYQHLQPCVRV